MAAICKEGLKAKIKEKFFKNFDTTKTVAGVDFCVAKLIADDENQSRLFVQNDLNYVLESFIWGEIKHSAQQDIYEPLAQLILTIGKERIYEKFLPPMFLAAFDEEKIVFVDYSEVSDLFYQRNFDWSVAACDRETEEFRLICNRITESLKRIHGIFYYDDNKAKIKAFIRLWAPSSRTEKVHITKANFIAVYLHWLETVKPTIDINWGSVEKYGIHDVDFYLADLMLHNNQPVIDLFHVELKGKIYSVQKDKAETALDIAATVPFKDDQEKHRAFWNRYACPPRQIFWKYIMGHRDLLLRAAAQHAKI